MKRQEAIKKISKLKISNLNRDERVGYLIGWWNIDKEDKEFNSLPDSLKNEMIKNDEYKNPEYEKYDSLILKALIHEYKGVRNEYIEREYNQITNDKVEVKGQVENFEKCPCCDYKTLEERRTWDICEVCYWEDDGIEDLDVNSGPNRMTLRKGKENFKNFGACKKELIQYTEKEPDLKYEK